jgi:hypothetical protein
MAEDYGVQRSFTVNGELFNLRGENVAEVKQHAIDLAGAIDDIENALNQVKEAVLLKGVLTGDMGGKKGGNSAQSESTTGSSGSPTCRHGAMKDLGDKGYKSRWYCSAKARDEQCKPLPF